MQTDILSFEEQPPDRGFLSQRDRIWIYLRRHPSGVLRSEIAKDMGVPINAVCGRVKELLDLSVIAEQGKRINQDTGKKSSILYAVEHVPELTRTYSRDNEIGDDNYGRKK